MSEEATKTNASPDAGNPPANDTGVKDTPSPNADYKSAPNLDDNGNPIDPKSQEAPPSPDAKEQVTPITPENTTVLNDKVEGVAKFIADAGLDMKTVAGDVTKNDGVTPEILAALVEKHGEGVASLIADKLESINSTYKEQAASKDKAVYDQVQEAFNDPQGGEATFKELAGWAKENIPNSERAEINKMLEQGGLAAKLAMKNLIDTFKGSESFTQPAALEVADSVSVDRGGMPLDKAGYDREMRKLISEGHEYGRSQEMEALDRRRTVGMKRGI